MPANPTWSETIQALETPSSQTPQTGNVIATANNPSITWIDTSLTPNRYFRLQDTGNGLVLSTSTDGVTFTALEQITDVTQPTIYRRLTNITLDLTGMAAPTALAERITVGSEANPRWQIDTGGAQSWGPGGGTAVDTTLSRAAAAVLSVGGNIRGTVAPSNVADLTRKDYVDTALALKLALAGGTMTGALQLAADPVSGLQAATKQYVDNKVGNGLFAEFSGAGAPASGTLSSGITYVIGNLYLDTTNLNMWVCTTGGSNSSSVWSPVLHTTSSNAFLKVPAYYSGSGTPAAGTLTAGTYAVGDLYYNTAIPSIFVCTGAGSASTSTWTPAASTIQPVIDSTTAFRVLQAGGTAFLVVDTTNKRVGINVQPGVTFDISGPAAGIATRYTDNTNASLFSAFSTTNGGTGRLYSDQNLALGSNSVDVITILKAGTTQINGPLALTGTRITQSTITVGASPFTYTNSDNSMETVYITGGTGTDVSFVRNSTTTSISSSLAADITVILSPGDAVKITYTGVPTMTKVLF